MAIYLLAIYWPFTYWPFTGHLLTGHLLAIDLLAWIRMLALHQKGELFLKFVGNCFGESHAGPHSHRRELEVY